MNEGAADTRVVVSHHDDKPIMEFGYKHFLETGQLLVPFQPASIPSALLELCLTRLPFFQQDTFSNVPDLAFDHIRAKVRQLATANNSSSAVISSPAQNAADYSVLFALGSGRRLFPCDNLVEGLRSACRAGMKSATVFGLLEDFDQTFLSEVWRLSREQRFQVGLIPGRSAQELQWWVTKRLFSNALYHDYFDAIILARDARASSFSDPPFVIAESDFDSEGAARLRAPHQFCLAQFHAKECCAKFNGHVFCGLKASARATP